MEGQDNIQLAGVNHVSMKIPPFWTDDPVLWFAQLESQFSSAGVSRDVSKFHAVTGALEQRYAAVVRDIILNPPATDKYLRLKSELIRRFVPSTESRIKQLLQSEEMGDRTPSQFLLHLRSLGDKVVNDDLLRILWLSRLPLRMQDILAAASTTDLDAMSLIADRISENSKIPSQVSTGEYLLPESLQTKLNEMGQQIAFLSSAKRSSKRTDCQCNCNGHTSQDRNQTQRVKSIEPSHQAEGICWYHRTYGDRATQCRQPCNFEAKNLSGRQ